jgi:uroporphyrinogen decarboxylase
MHGGLADEETGRCGALLAGMMIIGALYGRTDLDHDDALANLLARRYWDMFMETFGTDHCGTLKTGDPGPEYPSVCGTIMVRAASILTELLEEVAQSDDQTGLSFVSASGHVSRVAVTSRERVRLALAHREPDRVPHDLGTSGVTGIHVEALRGVLPYLGLEEKDLRVGSVLGQLAVVDGELRQRLRVDTQAVPRNPGGEHPEPEREGKYLTVRDKWGAVWAMPADEGHSFSPYRAPLADAESVRDIEEFPWPDVASPERVAAMAAEAERLHWQTDRALILGPCCLGFFQMGWLLRGFETFAKDLHTNPNLAEALLEKVLELKMAYWGALLPKVSRYVLVVREDDDYGMQGGLVISPETFRRYMRPRWHRLLQFVRRKATSRVYILFHSCGAVRPLIPDLIDLGVDVLNPVQVSAAGMDTATLKAEFGDDLTFWGGGIDTQRVLPHGNPGEVREEVRRRIADLAPGGGFVFATVHNIQADVPPENIIAMWEALEAYGSY